MSIVKNILVPTDFSECTQPALELAIDLSLAHRAGITLLHVHSTPAFELPSGYVENLPSQLDQTYEVLLRRLAALEGKLRSSGVIRVEKRLLQGQVEEEIVRFSEGFDCIVLGTQGRVGLERLIVGSVAEKVLERARCRVVVVRPVRTGN
jgi:nucleotide-binding universal stress UspA family protein